MWYFINPNSPKQGAHKRGRKGRRKMAKRQTAAQRRASLRNLAKARRALRGGGRKRRRASNPPPGGKRTVSWRKRPTTKRRYSYGRKQRRVVRTNPRRYRRRRNNPGFGTGFAGQIFTGFRDAALVLGGKAGSRIVANFVPLPQDGIMGTLVQVASTLGVSWAGRKFFGQNVGHMLLVGGMVGVAEPYIKMLPVIGPALGDEMEMGEYLTGEELPMGELPIGEYEVGEEEMGEYEVGEMYN